MSKPIIEIEGIGKRYRIGAAKEPYLSLRDEMTKWFSPAARRARAVEEEFWALKDVSFSVEQGEAVGIIGRNGAGKSTLLKILSQITPPTEGKITCRGRIASLLEVGTGFHPELTGRENIYMNGAILGMSRSEITRKFDEIVAFAEMEKFLDTPVKRYSSGMYVRLAFAVAAHLEPEVLIVDEVLAVGDMQFQKKCLGKMGEVARGGRTVLFVSHNMAAIQALCRNGVCLGAGKVICLGPIERVVRKYQEHGEALSSLPLHERLEREGDGRARLTSLRVNGREAAGSVDVLSGDRLTIDIAYEVFDVVVAPVFTLYFWDSGGLQLLFMNNRMGGLDIRFTGDKGVVSCDIAHFPLPAGDYKINISIREEARWIDRVETALHLRVEEGSYYGVGLSGAGAYSGKCLVEHTWTQRG